MICALGSKWSFKQPRCSRNSLVYLRRCPWTSENTPTCDSHEAHLAAVLFGKKYTFNRTSSNLHRSRYYFFQLSISMAPFPRNLDDWNMICCVAFNIRCSPCVLRGTQRLREQNHTCFCTSCRACQSSVFHAYVLVQQANSPLEPLRTTQIFCWTIRFTNPIFSRQIIGIDILDTVNSVFWAVDRAFLV